MTSRAEEPRPGLGETGPHRHQRGLGGGGGPARVRRRRGRGRAGPGLDATGEEVDGGGSLMGELQLGPSVGQSAGVAGQPGEEVDPGHAQHRTKAVLPAAHGHVATERPSSEGCVSFVSPTVVARRPSPSIRAVAGSAVGRAAPSRIGPLTTVRAMNEPVRVREVIEADEVPALTAALARLVPQLSRSAAPPSDAEVAEIVASPATRLLVALDAEGDGDSAGALGAMTLVVFRTPTGMRAWIEDVVVDGGARGRGVGETLNRVAMDLAAELGCRTVDLTSRPGREAANRLYQRLGFTPRETNVWRHLLE